MNIEELAAAAEAIRIESSASRASRDGHHSVAHILYETASRLYENATREATMSEGAFNSSPDSRSTELRKRAKDCYAHSRDAYDRALDQDS